MRRALLLSALAGICAAGAGAGTADRTGADGPASRMDARHGSAKPRPLRLRETCVRKSDHATLVRFTASDRTRLIGVALGRGRAGVVLGHQSEDNLCSWLPFARRLAGAGFRVLALDHRRHGSSGRASKPSLASRVDLDVVAAVRELRRRGVTSVVLAGASMGGSAVLAAGAAISPSVSGVISLSAPALFAGIDAVAAVRRTKVPLLLVAAEADADFADAARRFHAETSSPDKQLHIAGGGAHGTGLLQGAGAEPVRRLLEDFIRRHSSP